MAKATGPLYVVHFKRRREGKTNYNKRLGLLKSGIPRLVVRKTNRYLLVQVVSWNEKGDETVASVSSKALGQFGFQGKCNTPSAYLTGLLCGARAKAKGINEIILDAGLQTPSKGSVIFAALKGAVDAGLKSGFSEEILPSADRLQGKHLQKQAGDFEAVKQKIIANPAAVKQAGKKK